MKRYINQLLQQTRHQHYQREIPGDVHRDAPRLRIAAIAGLGSDDGYDWLRQIGTGQTIRSAGHRASA